MVQRERTSVANPGTGFPKLSRSATTGRASCQKDEVGFVSRATSASVRTLAMVPVDASSDDAVSVQIEVTLTQLFIESLFVPTPVKFIILTVVSIYC